MMYWEIPPARPAAHAPTHLHPALVKGIVLLVLLDVEAEFLQLRHGRLPVAPRAQRKVRVGVRGPELVALYLFFDGWNGLLCVCGCCVVVGWLVCRWMHTIELLDTYTDTHTHTQTHGP